MMSATMPQYPVNQRGRCYDPDVTDDQRTYSLLMHLGIIGFSVIGPLSVLIPIIMWQIKKGDSPFIDDHGREAVNFQISILIYSVIGVVVSIVTFGLGAILVVPGLTVFAIVGMVLAMVASNRGEYFRYPMTLRFIT
ncbi:MAG: DUF4870 domain-containing protein [Phycisphaerales bacterium JB040]